MRAILGLCKGEEVGARIPESTDPMPCTWDIKALCGAVAIKGCKFRDGVSWGLGRTPKVVPLRRILQHKPT